MSENLLEVIDLKTHFVTDEGIIPAVDGVSFSVAKGETLAIVGESGCGKSVTSLSIMGLIPIPPGKMAGGKVLFKGDNILEYNNKQWQKIRGNDIAMIFQEPMTSLNPLFTIGWQISEALMLHQNMNKNQAKEKAIEMLKLVGIPGPQKRVDQYPHELSGGMRQRVMIAMALSCNPDLLIADEPTTALDVTIQAQILKLMLDLKNEFNTAIILITHDLGVVAETADKVLVMYCGKPVEYTDIDTFLKEPLHPYSEGLIASIPKLDGEQEELQSIKGTVPSLSKLPKGCLFADRCPKAIPKCNSEHPVFREVKPNHKVACWLDSGQNGVI